MDFHSIISTAKQNISSTKEKGNFYKSGFEPPKKMLKEKKLTAGIQKFLEQQKKKEEEQAELLRRKKQELVARRDPKEQRKIDKSLKVIKSSQKFFSGESIEDNTADLQPDEDDYGYTSTVSDQIHKKLMEQYQSMPEQKKFSSSSAKHKAMSKEEMQRTKDRVKNSFTTPEEDQQQIRQPQHRTSRMKVEKDSKLRAGTLIEKKPFDKPKPKLKAAPIVDFQQLMKLAEQKQHEEITIEVKEKKEPERLLTQKEKREQEELEAARKAKMKPNRIPKLGAIPRLGDSSKQDKNNNDNSAKKSTTSQSSQFAKPLAPSARPPLNSKRPAVAPSTNNSSKLRDALQQRPNGDSSKTTNHKVPNSSKLSGTPSSSSSKYRETPQMKSAINNRPSSSSANIKQDKPRTPAASTSKVSDKPRDFPPKDLLRTREFPPKDLMRSREFPPKDLMRSREFPPRDLTRRKENSKQLSQQQISRKRRVIDDEESDYDSEMDDFIDDGDDDGDSLVSSEIKKIFGYDKSRYRDEDFDDSQMESDYRTVMKEEFISKKLGIMEDLEDMRMEEEEKKQKAMRKKRRL